MKDLDNVKAGARASCSREVGGDVETRCTRGVVWWVDYGWPVSASLWRVGGRSRLVSCGEDRNTNIGVAVTSLDGERNKREERLRRRHREDGLLCLERVGSQRLSSLLRNSIQLIWPQLGMHSHSWVSDGRGICSSHFRRFAW